MNIKMTNEQVKIQIGQVWHDKNRKWTSGSNELDAIHLILSADKMNGDYYYRTAMFIWCADGYMGARINDFLENEIRLMECIGTIESIKHFKP